jgi:hypothetical protein
MDEVFRIMEGFFRAAPWPTAIIICTIIVCKFGGNLIPKNKYSDRCDIEKNPEYVLKTECHSHIDGLKEEINARFGEMNLELREIRKLVFEAIKGRT